MSFSVAKANIILAFINMDVDAFEVSYIDFVSVTGNITEESVEAVLEVFPKIALEKLSHVSHAEKVQFISSCIDVMDIPSVNKKFEKLKIEYNMDVTLDRRLAIVQEMKVNPPEGKLRFILERELDCATALLDEVKIAQVLQEIQAL